MKCFLGVVATLFVLTDVALMPSFAQAGEEPVAIVLLISGKAFVTFEGRRMDLRLLEGLKPGAAVQTDADSKVVLAFCTGDRYEFGANVSGIVRLRAIESKKGVVQKLPPLPNMIEIAPIAKKAKPGSRLAAARIRTGEQAGTSIPNLCPSNGAATVAEAALLSFDPVEGYQKYQVDVENKTGSTVFSVETASTVVQISHGVLQPGANYYWRVRTLDPEKPAVRGEAVFVTVSEENARVRAALKEQTQKANDPVVLALLVALDFGLGLEREACEELKAALDQTPGNRAIQEALSRFECTRTKASVKNEGRAP